MADEAESHYQHLVLNGEISQGEADVLEQLRSISETLKEVTHFTALAPTTNLPLLRH